MVNARLYVLCPDVEARERALHEYTKPWEVPIVIPQTSWLESIMYVSELMSRYDEWRDMDYVGCISHTAHTKQPGIHDIEDLLKESRAQGSDIVAFLPGGYRDIVLNGEQYHPGFQRAWNETWTYLGFDQERMSEPCFSFFCNYWCATPEFMTFYCSLFSYFHHRLERTPSWKRTLWTNARYRGSIPPDTLRTLFGVPYYPLLPFVAERMICPFAKEFAIKGTSL